MQLIWVSYDKYVTTCCLCCLSSEVVSATMEAIPGISIALNGQFGYQHVFIHTSDEQELGRGSYGSVVRAKLDDLPCAAKILHYNFFNSNDPAARNFAARFQRECQILRDMKHPNIVQFLGVVQEPVSGRLVLFMEMMRESLTNFLEVSSICLPYHVQIDVSYDIALAVAHLHRNKILHRDLSSNNILLNAGAQAKVTDFGMSKIADSNPSMTRSRLTQCPGTLVYMPPEALLASPRYSEKLDTFSLGVLMIQIITRKFPAPTSSQITLDDPRSPTGEIIIPVSEMERRKSDIEDIPPDHTLLPIVRDCLKDRHQQRPKATEISQFLSSIKTLPVYQESSSEMPDLLKSLSQKSLTSSLTSPTRKKLHSQSTKEEEDTEDLPDGEVIKKEKEEGKVEASKLFEKSKFWIIKENDEMEKEDKDVKVEKVRFFIHNKKKDEMEKEDKEDVEVGETMEEDREDQPPPPDDKEMQGEEEEVEVTNKDNKEKLREDNELTGAKTEQDADVKDEKEEIPVERTELHVAAVLGDVEAVKRLLTTSVNINSRTDDKGYTALLLAALKGHVAIVKLLIGANAMINLQDENGFSPVCAASHGGHTEIVELLVQAGADIHLATTKSGNVPVEIAADNGQAKTVHRLLELGADPNHQNISGQTPLFAAALKGHSTVVKILLEKKAGVNICSNIGCSPVYVASQEGHTEAVELLAQGGADIHLATNEYGSVPLMTAAFNGHTETVKKLLELGANPNYKNKFCCTALDMARNNNHQEVERILEPLTQSK